MIDLHSHVLPGVDDGARTLDVAVRVLARFAADGVTTLVCTPHLRASAAAAAPVALVTQRLDELRRRAGRAAPALRLGWEILLDEPGMPIDRAALRLGGAAAVLVEFPRSGIPPRATHELARIRDSGVVPVLAHPERYWGVSVAHVNEWRAVGAVMQVDVAPLLSEGDRGRIARLLLEQGLVHLLASDNHGDARALRPARDWLVELGAIDHADLLTARNAHHVLAGEPLEEVPPLALPRGVLVRLRELLLGARRTS